MSRLVTSGEMLELSYEAGSTPHITISTTKKRQWVIVAGNSLLRGTEVPIHCPDRLSRELYSLPGVCTKNAPLRLPSLTPSTDCHPLLIHVGWYNQEQTGEYQEGLQSPWSHSKGLWNPVNFSSILPVKAKGFERASQIWWFSKRLQDWCHSQGFSHWDHGTCFEKAGLREADGKSISGCGLAQVVDKALNSSFWGREPQSMPLLPVWWQCQPQIPRAWRGIAGQQESTWYEPVKKELVKYFTY